MKPRARDEQIIIEQVDDDLLVYDEKTHQAHRLNRTAALVFRGCDGQTPVSQLAARLERELGVENGESLVQLALSELQEAHLLQRRVLTARNIAVATGSIALLVPVVETLLAPAPAAAFSF